MSEILVGDLIAIPCRVKEVGFKDEKLIDFDTMDGKMAGFVRTLELRQVGDEWEVRGVIDKVEADRLVAWVKGEFFHTSGKVQLRRDNFVKV